jgi:hypothetical protein
MGQIALWTTQQGVSQQGSHHRGGDWNYILTHIGSDNINVNNC